ncbi:MAG: hypothetical protein AAF533_10495 [Acidobacteriota bacterium]
MTSSLDRLLPVFVLLAGGLLALACGTQAPSDGGSPGASTQTAPTSQPASSASQPAATTQAARSAATDFTLVDAAGVTHRLSERRGEPTVLVFYRGVW